MRPFLTALVFGIGITVIAQDGNNIEALLRADLRNEKHAIVMATLDLSEEQRALFMPIYEEYSAAVRAHWDKRLALVDDYAKAQETMDDGAAALFLERLHELEVEDYTIRRSYARKVAKVLPTTIAARWMQVERRLSQLLELQVANDMPVIPMKN